MYSIFQTGNLTIFFKINDQKVFPTTFVFKLCKLVKKMYSNKNRFILFLNDNVMFKVVKSCIYLL